MSSDSSTTLCAARPLSPCIQVCNIDPASSLCQGCGRTLDEIACWGSMTEAEKTRYGSGLSKQATSMHYAEKSASPLLYAGHSECDAVRHTPPSGRRS